MANLRDTLTPKDWPDAGTPEFWERFGCEGSNEYRDCDAMSADYARLRRLERRVEALVTEAEDDQLVLTDDVRAALKDEEISDGVEVVDDEDDCCPCGTCIETIGYDPDIPCPHCPVHGRQ